MTIDNQGPSLPVFLARHLDSRHLLHLRVRHLGHGPDSAPHSRTVSGRARPSESRQSEVGMAVEGPSLPPRPLMSRRTTTQLASRYCVRILSLLDDY